jgi:hypothetical protein
MRKKLIVALALIALASCIKINTVPTTYAVLYAQSFPTTVHCVVNPNPVADGVVSYKFQLNTGTPIVLPATACTATACSQVLTIPAPGSYSCNVFAENLKLSTDPTSLQDSAAAVANFLINNSPGKPTGTNVTN